MIIRMSLPHLFFLKEKGTVWFNPSQGIIGFWNEYKKLNQKLNKPHQEIWSHRDLKRAKEIYAISIMAKVMAKQEGGIWWIHKPKDDPPDGIIGTMIENMMHLREIEVVEHIKGDILDTIRTKLSRKQYEPNTILVCYISQGGVFDLQKQSEIISKEITSLENIFLVFPGVNAVDIPKNKTGDDLLKSIYKLSAVQLKPAFSFSSVDPIEDCKAWSEGKEASFFIFKGIGKDGFTPINLKEPPRLF